MGLRHGSEAGSKLRSLPGTIAALKQTSRQAPGHVLAAVQFNSLVIRYRAGDYLSRLDFERTSWPKLPRYSLAACSAGKTTPNKQHHRKNQNDIAN